HHLEFVLRGHGRLQHHAIKKQKPPTWRGFVSNLKPLFYKGFFFFPPSFSRAALTRAPWRRRAAPFLDIRRPPRATPFRFASSVRVMRERNIAGNTRWPVFLNVAG
ncbi:hypothetical protein, partial [Burkholderia pseudomallei]